MPTCYAFSKNLVFNKVKDVGLTMCKYFMAGAAPISDLTRFLSVWITNYEFGASETTDQLLLMLQWDLKCMKMNLMYNVK